MADHPLHYLLDQPVVVVNVLELDGVTEVFWHPVPSCVAAGGFPDTLQVIEQPAARVAPGRAEHVVTCASSVHAVIRALGC